MLASQQTIPERWLVSCRAQIQSPGTEFLDAETGDQESTRENLNPFSENSFVTN
jgi:hypothetical protein